MNNENIRRITTELRYAAEGSAEVSVHLSEAEVQEIIGDTVNETLVKWMNERLMITGSYPTGEEVMDWLNQ